MKVLNTFFLLLIVFCNPFKILAQNGTPKTLLWRISGNGLSKPSYLYGTMHLYDKRLFQFGDSVYSTLAKSDGYAMELDPDSMMDSMLVKLNEKDTTSLLEQMMDKKQYDTIAKKLEKKMGVPADRITKKMMVDARRKDVYKRWNKDDMNTAVDLYLYDIARKQGKWVGGIEDVADQTGIIDEIDQKFDVTEYLAEDESKIKKGINHMISLYVSEDLDKINEWIDAGGETADNNLLINVRNIKMARRMDSLSKIRTTFFAVGAAHLSGTAGVITLLKSKGFTVDPVFSSKKIAPSDYKFTAKVFAWTKVEGPDSLYSVEMPGIPTDINKYGDELKMKMYGDLTTNIFYITGCVGTPDNENKDDVIKRAMQNFSAGEIDAKDKKNITVNGIEGVEVNAIKDNVFCRVRIFFAGNKEYLAIVGSLNQDNLQDKDADRFFKSLVMNAGVVIKVPGWETYPDSAKAFSILFPKKPEIYILPPEKIQKNWSSVLYSVLDLKTNTYYIVGVNETKKGYLMYADSSYFNEHYERIVSDTNNFNLQKKIVEYNGLPAMSVVYNSIIAGEEIVSSLLIINRGNRSYSLITVTDKKRKDSPNISQFYNSFKLLPWKVPEWQTRTVNNTFSTWSPSSIDLDQTDTAGLVDYELEQALETNKKRLQFLTFDPYSSTSYNIMAYPVSPYYWTGTDSAFYDDETARYYTNTSGYHAFKNPGNIDSLIYSREVKNGNFNGREILVKNAGTLSYKKIRVIRSGDSVYHLISFILKSDLDDSNNTKFFHDFSIKGPVKAGHIFENKTFKILADLSDKDSATHANALTALRTSKFTNKDLPLLLPAIIKEYPNDSASATNKVLVYSIDRLLDDSAINFIKNAYQDPAMRGSIKQNLLELLARHKTLYSYKTLNSLLVNNPPHERNYTLAYYLKDSMQLCASLFPAIEKLYDDSLLAPLVIDLSVTLIDSQLLSKPTADQFSSIYKVAKRNLSGYKADKDYEGEFNSSVINMLSIINTKESEELLNKFLRLPDIVVKQEAALALLKFNKAVSVAEINKIAANKYNRVYFYHELKKIGKEHNFPLQWYSQRLFAESILYNYIQEDDEMDAPKTLQFISEKTALVKEKMYRFLLFKATFDIDGEKQDHLAVCGPFNMDKNKSALDEDEERSRLFYEEKFNSSKINSLFKTYLEDINRE